MTPLKIPTPELVGALGDLMWAAFVPPIDHINPLPVDILVVSDIDDDEFAVHRLLLAGYQKAHDYGPGRSLWLSPKGERIRLLQEDTPWSREAIMAGTRNRDGIGAPHFTLPFAALERLRRVDESRREIQILLAGATCDELAELDSLLTRLAPDLRPIADALTRPWP